MSFKGGVMTEHEAKKKLTAFSGGEGGGGGVRAPGAGEDCDANSLIALIRLALMSFCSLAVPTSHF